MIYKLHFVQSNKTVDYDSVADKHLSILDMAFDNGIDVRAGCRSGYCGTCQSTILKGEVKYFYDPPTSADLSTILLCSCYPISNLEINR